ncbi:DNA-binding MarR family transcriptional regulator [Amycolatopsis bartoniae]|uniref:MarR family transcriptional regulator n=1 Tax=Amycolatopsis bartoniae TaxID=941986 RepID=A0A8H9IQ88_9PSEU|nr:MarR family transcriptional regulator [Amycolatopsis bartoniae]MBB2938066.1 DNA-binding MarR family transcriptional regulator [Amycolatopsis bartoniae]TVT09926.1 MarR family transcriptional regulator [Amycolatopsis bartoniae]GHF32444.1 MarR family transcriptional regulator [Amycolatopsis bartoniae]
MPTRRAAAPAATNDVDAVTDAVLTASRLLVAVSARSIAAVDESITIPQFRLLVVLHTRGPLKLSALAESLGVNPSTATRMVDRLVAAELVSRQANPASRRELVVSLTGTGEAVVREVTQRRRKEIARIVSRMAVTTRRGLVRALNAFAEAGDEPDVADQGDALWL